MIRWLFCIPMHFSLKMTGADMDVSMLQLLLLLLTAVIQAAVALKNSMLTTDLLHTVLCMDCRTQTLRTRKVSRRLAATHNADRRQQRYQWTSGTDGRSTDGESHTEKVTVGNKTVNWTVPIKRRWHCRHISFTTQLPFVCAERSEGQLIRDAWKSGGESEIHYIVEHSKKDSCAGNWQQQWTSTINVCSHMLHIVAGGQNCQLGGLDPKPRCISSSAYYEHHKHNGSWQVELVHLVPI